MDQEGELVALDPFGVVGDGGEDSAGVEGHRVAVNGGLPADVLAVWGVSEKDIRMAEHLVGAWGLETFRGSAIHKAAVQEKERLVRRKLSARMVPDFKKERK